MVGECWRPSLETVKKELDRLIENKIDEDEEMPIGIVDAIAHLHSELEVNGVAPSNMAPIVDAKAGE